MAIKMNTIRFYVESRLKSKTAPAVKRTFQSVSFFNIFVEEKLFQIRKMMSTLAAASWKYSCIKEMSNYTKTTISIRRIFCLCDCRWSPN